MKKEIKNIQVFDIVLYCTYIYIYNCFSTLRIAVSSGDVFPESRTDFFDVSGTYRPYVSEQL